MNLVPLKTFIRKLEARGSFDTIWGGIKKADYPSHNLTQMSVGEVLDWQRRIRAKGYASTACGGYQFIYKTLSALVSQSKVPLSTKFDAALQDAFAERLMAARGLGKYISGQISAEAFCNELAKEWASLPLVSGPNKGRSYYHGDGLNKSLTDVGPFLDAVRAIKLESVVKTDAERSTGRVATQTGIGVALTAAALAVANWWSQIEAWFRSVFGG